MTPATDPHFLLDALPPPGPFQLDGPEGRHAALVRRMRPGEPLVLTDGRGGRARSVVAAVDRSTVTVEVGPAEHVQPPQLRVVVVQALPKGERGELAVELATEAGADEIIPWAAARCVTRWSMERATRGLARWRSSAREAAKQSRRAFVPPVGDVADLAAVVTRVRSGSGALVLHEAAPDGIADARLPESGELLLVVGPEGGITGDEVSALAAAGAHPVRLGPEVLRTSTAAAVALGALGVLTGRWPTARPGAGPWSMASFAGRRHPTPGSLRRPV